ncbi:epoxide hydrolase [Ewingella americana]|nr:epoxide hydrolase [Ewingella americana]
MITPYHINIPEQRLTAIAKKVAAYDWSQLPDLGRWRAGVGVKDLQRLVDYWQNSYDWRRTEQRLNQLPNFMAEIEGEHIHFVHVSGNGSKPPVLLLHGWPGSYLEFEQLLAPLAEEGHDVIVPSLPGFAFSQPITGVIGPRRAAELMYGLMGEMFGQTRFIVQGGDWGSGIAAWLAHQHPDALLGIHLNMADLLAKDTPASTPEEKNFVAQRKVILDWEAAYNHQQETRPQTLAVALADSPVGAAGWILEKIGTWAELPQTADGSPDLWSKFTEEELLTNIMLYLAPSSMVTASWMYHGKRLEDSDHFPAGTKIQVPTGFAAFRDPVFIPPPRSYAEKTFNIVHWSEMPAGGHFAAWEQPELLLQDLRAFIAKVS